MQQDLARRATVKTSWIRLRAAVSINYFRTCFLFDRLGLLGCQAAQAAHVKYVFGTLFEYVRVFLHSCFVRILINTRMSFPTL